MHEAVLMPRRTLLALGGSALALSALSLPAMARSSQPVRYVVVDRRHAASVDFARQWHGSAVLDVADGLTRLWRDALLPLWQTPGGTVTGLTSPGVWTCLAEQARSQGRRGQRVEPSATQTSHSLVAWVIA